MKHSKNSRGAQRAQRPAYSGDRPFGAWADELFALRPDVDDLWSVIRFSQGADEPDVLRRGLCEADAVREAFDIGAHGFRLLVCDGRGWSVVYAAYDAGARQHRATELQRVAHAASVAYQLADEVAGWLV